MSRFLRGLNAIAYSGALLFSAFGFTTAAHPADDWPTRPITIIVPACPGGATRLLSRLLADEMQDDLGQAGGGGNKAGAAGTIGTQQLTGANPDGHTLIIGNIGAAAINSHMYEHLPYPRDDFAAISMVLSVPNVLVVNKNTEVDSVQGLVDLLHSEPESFAFGSSGLGQSPHLSAELFMLRTDTDAVHVPFKGRSEERRVARAGG